MQIISFILTAYDANIKVVTNVKSLIPAYHQRNNRVFLGSVCGNGKNTGLKKKKRKGKERKQGTPSEASSAITTFYGLTYNITPKVIYMGTQAIFTVLICANKEAQSILSP